MLRYLFKPRLSLFDTTAMAFVFGSAPYLGWWALIAAFILIAVSCVIDVALTEEATHDPK